MAEPALTVCEDLEGAAAAARARIVSAAHRVLRERERFTLCVDGGRPTQRLLQLLGEDPAAIPWERTVLLLGDERCVPLSDPRSNRGMVQRLLVGSLPRRPKLCGPDGEKEDSRRAADDYEDVWRREVGAGVDLLVLGMGPDGHTESLFPGSPALREADRLVQAVPAPTTVEPKVNRLTLTPPAILAAREVLLFAVGAEKRQALERLLAPSGSEEETPARVIRRHPLAAAVIADRAARGA